MGYFTGLFENDLILSLLQSFLEYKHFKNIENYTFFPTAHFIDIYEDKHLPLIPFITPFLLQSLLSDPGAFRLHSTEYIQLCCGSEHGSDTSIDTRVIQSYHRDMMQCWASIITLISQWPAVLLDPPPREAHAALVLLQIS